MTESAGKRPFRDQVVASIALLLVFTVASAEKPLSGVWAVVGPSGFQNVPGTGLAVDVQNDVLFLTIMSYDEDTGGAVFHAGSTDFTPGEMMDLPLFRFGGGAWPWSSAILGDGLAPVELVHSQIQFYGLASGEVTIDGVSQFIRHFEYGPPDTRLQSTSVIGPAIAPSFDGEWLLVFGGTGIDAPPIRDQLRRDDRVADAGAIYQGNRFSLTCSQILDLEIACQVRVNVDERYMILGRDLSSRRFRGVRIGDTGITVDGVRLD